jgi:hypothetical protein
MVARIEEFIDSLNNEFERSLRAYDSIAELTAVEGNNAAE